MNLLRLLWKAIDTVLAMSGLRLDAGRYLLAWIPLIGVSGCLAYQAKQSGYVIEFAIASWIFYYIGISLILGTGIKRFMILKLGEKTALNLYDMICGLMFFNIGSGIALAALQEQDAFQLSPALKWGLFGLLALVGFGIKFWATWIVGVNTYYFRDLFLERIHREFTVKGPYKLLANPMYGVGNLHAYCTAVLTGSLFGLWFALTCHLGIYAFFFIVERTFIKRIYQNG